MKVNIIVELKSVYRIEEDPKGMYDISDNFNCICKTSREHFEMTQKHIQQLSYGKMEIKKDED